MRVKSKIKIVRFPVFSNYTVHVEITSDIIKAMKKYKYTENIEGCEAYDACSVHVENENMSFIFLPLDVNAGVVAHECYHVVHNIMEYVGAALDSEVIAYHLEYLVNEVFKLKRNRRQ
jgi:hypothetical protein